MLPRKPSFDEADRNVGNAKLAAKSGFGQFAVQNGLGLLLGKFGCSKLRSFKDTIWIYVRPMPLPAIKFAISVKIKHILDMGSPIKIGWDVIGHNVIAVRGMMFRRRRSAMESLAYQSGKEDSPFSAIFSEANRPTVRGVSRIQTRPSAYGQFSARASKFIGNPASDPNVITDLVIRKRRAYFPFGHTSLYGTHFGLARG